MATSGFSPRTNNWYNWESMTPNCEKCEFIQDAGIVCTQCLPGYNLVATDVSLSISIT